MNIRRSVLLISAAMAAVLANPANSLSDSELQTKFTGGEVITQAVRSCTGKTLKEHWTSVIFKLDRPMNIVARRLGDDERDLSTYHDIRTIRAKVDSAFEAERLVAAAHTSMYWKYRTAQVVCLSGTKQPDEEELLFLIGLRAADPVPLQEPVLH